MHPRPVESVHHHAVQFYGSESTLCSNVASFIGQGLADDQPAVIIATEPHTIAILDQLRSRFFDIDAAQRLGRLIVLDAHRSLPQFMIGERPDPDAFEQSIGSLFGRLVRRRSDRSYVRAYGEMVDVLWKAGMPDAALALERLWNRLAARFGFALMCAYAMKNFSSDTDLFEEVCRQHTHVVPSRSLLATPRVDHRIQ